MYPITNAVKALFEAEQRQTLRITGTDRNNEAIHITDADVVSGGFGIDRYSCNGSKLEIGTAISAELTLKLDNRDGQYDDIVFEGTELTVEVGIADWSQTTPTITYIPCGKFTPDNQPRTLDTISIQALDRMTRFDKAVDESDLSLPATVASLIGQVCTECGVPFSQDVSELPNTSFSIAAMPEIVQGVTYRNLIQWCAGIMGTNAWIDWTGSLVFSWYGESTGYTSIPGNRFNSDLHEDDITITGVQYTNTQGTTIVSGTADYALDMTGNYLAASGIAEIMGNINAAINGFTYRPFTASVIGAPYLWPMDSITFTDRNSTNHTAILTNVNFGLNRATSLKGKGETAQANAGASPSGMTTEQAFLVERAKQAAIDDVDESLTQQDIFNRLTENGALQGLYMRNGQLYFNGTYIRGGTLVLGGLNNENGLFQVLDASGNVVVQGNNNGLQINNGSISFETSNGTVNINTEYAPGERLPIEIVSEIEGAKFRTYISDAAVSVSRTEPTSGGGVRSYGTEITSDGITFLGHPLAVKDGGTGAGNAALARENLGAVALNEIVLASGTYSPGNVAAGARDSTTITFADVGTSNYTVICTPLVGEISCGVQNKTATSFALYYKNTDTASVRPGTIHWTIIKLP